MEKQAAENWLLTLAIRYYVPLNRICGSRQDVEAQWNIGWHGIVEYKEMASVLQHLRQSGQVEILVDDGKSVDDEKVLPLHAHIDWDEVLCARENKLSYRLSLVGARRWEDTFEPRWEWFSAGLFPSENCYRVEAIGESEAVAAAHWAISQSDGRIVNGSDAGEKLIPWHATYWKTLPQGYCYTCSFDRIDQTKEYLRAKTPQETKLLTDAKWRTEHWYNIPT